MDPRWRRLRQPWPWVTLASWLLATASAADASALRSLLRTISSVPPNVTDFSVHFVLTNINKIDEAKGVVEAHVAIQMFWKDQRWSEAIGLYCQEASGTAAEQCADDAEELWEYLEAKRSRRWVDSALRLQKDLLPGFTGRNPWSPVPAQLLPEEVGSITDSEPWRMVRVEGSEKLFGAAWFDTDVTRFGVTLDYKHWPMDDQVMELCLPPLAAELEPLALDGLVLPSVRDAGPSDLSPALSEAAVRSIEAKGFLVEKAKLRKENKGIFWQLCLDVTVKRKVSIIGIRFALPLAMLLFVPFVGFYMPVTAAMPRVATGFLSFLALTVFRNMAYGMLPRKIPMLLWIDVIMLTTNEILFLCVIQNIVAQRLHKRMSNFAAEFFDNRCRWAFPISSFLQLALLVLAGYYHVDTYVLLWASQLGVLIVVGALLMEMLKFWKDLPHRILRHLMQLLESGQLLRDNDYQLDPRELASVFKLVDRDGSGFVEASEIERVMEEHGFVLETEMERMQFRETINQACKKADEDPDDEVLVDFEGFSTHFREFFGGRMARQMHKHDMRSKSRIVKENVH